MAQAKRPSSLIKMGGSASTLNVDNVSWKRISIVDLNHFQIVMLAVVVLIYSVHIVGNPEKTSSKPKLF
jgi:hypothetical protein